LTSPARGTAKQGGGASGLRRFAVAAFVVGSAFLPIAAPAAAADGVSIVARATGSQIAVFRAPGAKRPFHVFHNPGAHGAPVVFLVRRRVPGWEQVSIPLRPNGAVGWVRTRSVALALDPYRVTVSLHLHSIVVSRHGRALLRGRVAVGRPGLPTPVGRFYVVELLEQSNRVGPYGPYAFGLSAFSTVLFNFGGGPGQIGIHGTDQPALLGTSVSHGCIRIANALVTRLARILPLGTPVVISR
jgi:lipoprotein-anchoring transpeptidase ErfK/SrfK